MRQGKCVCVCWAILWYLSYPVGSVHGLQVPHGVPVVLHKHHGVCARQVQTQTSHMRGEEQHVYGRVIVEPEREREREE